MSYTGKIKYTSRKEKLFKVRRRIKYIVLLALGVLLVYMYFNRIDLIDYIRTYFR